MRVRQYSIAALIALIAATSLSAEISLRGSPASMNRQHDIAVAEELTFYRTPAAVLAEVEAGTLTPLTGNENYRVANVSFAYAVPEVRLLVERLSQQYRSACGEPLVVTSLTRPKMQQPRNAHALSVHPAGMAVDLRISQQAECRAWLERTLLSLERAGVLDVTRERMPPHYHVAVFPSPYREYVERIEAARPVEAPIEPVPMPIIVPVMQAAVAPAAVRGDQAASWWLWVLPLILVGGTAGATLRKRRLARD